MHAFRYRCLSVPPADIEKVCKDMFRVLRPGGWALHSIDAPANALEKLARAGSSRCARRASGEQENIETRFGGALAPQENDPPFFEPLSIRMRFSQGYRRGIWGDETLPESRADSATILVAAQKPAND